jgi:hypothetical protein
VITSLCSKRLLGELVAVRLKAHPANNRIAVSERITDTAEQMILYRQSIIGLFKTEVIQRKGAWRRSTETPSSRSFVHYMRLKMIKPNAETNTPRPLTNCWTRGSAGFKS